MDVFDENKNFALIKKKLGHKIISNEAIVRGLRKDEDDEVKEKKEEDKAKNVDFPKDDIEKLLKSLSLHDSIPKLKEHEIEDPALFWAIEEGELIGLLDIKTEGKKFRFKEAFKKAKETHEKEKLKKEEQ